MAPEVDVSDGRWGLLGCTGGSRGPGAARMGLDDDVIEDVIEDRWAPLGSIGGSSGPRAARMGPEDDVTAGPGVDGTRGGSGSAAGTAGIDGAVDALMVRSPDAGRIGGAMVPGGSRGSDTAS